MIQNASGNIQPASGKAVALGQGEIGAQEKQAVIPACGLVVFENRQAPGTAGELNEACSKFCLVVSGHARWECLGRRYMLGPDTVCHISAGQTHRQETLPCESVLTYALHYQPRLLSPALRSQLTALGMVSLDLGAATTQSRVIRSLFQEILFEQHVRQEGWETILQSRLMDLAVRILRLARRRSRNDLPAFEPGSDSTDRVARYVLRLKARFFRQETITEAARSVGLSRRQFSELFRKATGQCWRRYVLALRLKHAAGLLADSNNSVSAVAFESGFDDLSNFHHSFKSAYGCSPMTYREQRRVRLPDKVQASPESLRAGAYAPGFKFRGMKGWSWTAEQYLDEIPVLSSLKLNFLMNCYRSMSASGPGEPWRNEWWKPMPDSNKRAYARIIGLCREKNITFCFSMHPQLASPRPLKLGNAIDVQALYQNYAWAYGLGVRWFSICLDDTSWGASGPAVCGAAHAGLVNAIFSRLQTECGDTQLAFCPTACWGDGTNPEHNAYLTALGCHMHPDVYIFWNGDSVVTPRITRVAAESYRRVVKHRLFLWDNYPVNDGSPTMHLGPVSGREADLCEVVDGFMSNSMCTQSQINRIPLATCADYACSPAEYNPARSIGQAILRFGKTTAQQALLKELVESYPGFIVAGGGTGTNPVRAKFGSVLAAGDPRAAGQRFIQQIQGMYSRLTKLFPTQYPAEKQTVLEDINWMKQQLA